MTRCSHCEEERVCRCSYADCPFEVDRADKTIATLRAERDEARETNRNLNRRVQRFEGMETSFRMSNEMWGRVLFKSAHDPTKRFTVDFADWCRNVDKAFAEGRAEAAEASLAEVRKALEISKRLATNIFQYVVEEGRMSGDENGDDEWFAKHAQEALVAIRTALARLDTPEKK